MRFCIHAKSKEIINTRFITIIITIYQYFTLHNMYYYYCYKLNTYLFKPMIAREESRELINPQTRIINDDNSMF
jgi:hypothetical protein